jgi:tungstate transport system permease protein
MDDLGRSFWIALDLVAGRDPQLVGIVLLSLRVSLSAAAIAFVVGAPLGAALTVSEFRGKALALVAANALLGLPPVVVGLGVYLLISRAGPLGTWGLLFTPTAMVIAQAVLATPIVVALTHRLIAALWAEYGDALRVDGASRIRSGAVLLAMGRAGLATVFLAAFGRAVAEVGAILVVGGNIRGETRTMTTAIALETSKGDLGLALGLGLVLVAITFAVTGLVLALERRATPERGS